MKKLIEERYHYAVNQPMTWEEKAKKARGMLRLFQARKRINQMRLAQVFQAHRMFMKSDKIKELTVSEIKRKSDKFIEEASVYQKDILFCIDAQCFLNNIIERSKRIWGK